MSTQRTIEPDLEFGTAEVTMTFLVAHLNWKDQNAFIRAMNKESFGVATEGEYHSLDPPRLVGGSLLRTATFSFLSLPYVKGEIDLVVAASIGDGMKIAKKHNANLLSVSHRLEEKVA